MDTKTNPPTCGECGGLKSPNEPPEWECQNCGHKTDEPDGTPPRSLPMKLQRPELAWRLITRLEPTEVFRYRGDIDEMVRAFGGLLGRHTVTMMDRTVVFADPYDHKRTEDGEALCSIVMPGDYIVLWGDPTGVYAIEHLNPYEMAVKFKISAYEDENGIEEADPRDPWE